MSYGVAIKKMHKGTSRGKPSAVSAINGLLQGSLSAKEAASQVAEHCVVSSESDLDVNPHTTWQFILDTAKEFPEKQDRLVELLQAVKRLPDLETNGKPVIVHDMKVWSDLPYFGWTSRDNWNCEYVN